MNLSTLTRFATTALVAGFAGLAFAAPASALEAPDPEVGGLVNPSGGSSTTSSDDPWMEIGIGALGGLVLAGAGVAAAAGIRHRSAVPTA